ncbi:hypothetical protein Cni_G14382 [Canna indica]|uniref:DUF7610 domain-containing protein n=1 Tax=Canna indica TaxID=4628 RepID=A0AAQ3QDY7_9LILI|nr:hypothetical protein Cni_G14382 [Canna indica]
MKRRPIMERPYAALHKNLAELESRLRELAVVNPDSFKHQMICDEMAGKIEFVKALLAAEMEIHANSPPLHILHLAERLGTVEEELRRWDSFNVSPKDDDLPRAAMCMCTDECFDVDVGEEEEVVVAEEEEDEDYDVPKPEREEEDDGVEVPEPEDFGTVMDENLEYLGQRRSEESNSGSSEAGDTEQSRRTESRCRFIGAATALAATLAIGIWLATNFHSVEDEFFLVPT